jgi:hypothetical protein
MRKMVFIILLVCLSSIYYFSDKNNENGSIQSKIVKVKEIISNSAKAVLSNNEATTNNQQASADLTNNTSTEELDFSKLNQNQMNAWVDSESSIMNSTQIDTDNKMVQLRAQAQTLSLEQMQNLKNHTVSIEAAANSRILAAYLITLNLSNDSVVVLADLAINPLPNHGPSVPHSEAELKNTQELALRYMAIDELFIRAKTDNKAYAELKLISETANSAQVRNYAEKKLKELKN